nr:translation initiation factor 2, small GTP-binding protein [Tanacetum cinerariifolium]
MKRVPAIDVCVGSCSIGAVIVRELKMIVFASGIHVWGRFARRNIIEGEMTCGKYEIGDCVEGAWEKSVHASLSRTPNLIAASRDTALHNSFSGVKSSLLSPSVGRIRGYTSNSALLGDDTISFLTNRFLIKRFHATPKLRSRRGASLRKVSLLSGVVNIQAHCMSVCFGEGLSEKGLSDEDDEDKNDNQMID